MPNQLFLLDSSITTIKSKTTLGPLIYGPNYFNITFPLKIPIQNVSRITLKSVEIPLLMHQQRNENISKQFPSFNVI